VDDQPPTLHQTSSAAAACWWSEAQHRRKKTSTFNIYIMKDKFHCKKKIHHGIGRVRRIVDSLIVKNKLMMMFLCNTFLLFVKN
jgi:hypothetical protein